MLRRLILTFALALLFGLGQQGAIVHEISHYADLAPLSQNQDQAPHSGTCDLCLSFSGLANALGASHAFLASPATGFIPALFTSNSHDSLTSSYYSARAPPYLA
jgi:hypothetical protein